MKKQYYSLFKIKEKLVNGLKKHKRRKKLSKILQ
jgi:hypothetical protein